jgi:hypothetical protein
VRPALFPGDPSDGRLLVPAASRSRLEVGTERCGGHYGRMRYRSVLRGEFAHPACRLGLLSLSAAVGLFISHATALGGPCTAQIEQLERQIAEAGPAPPPEPIAPQSTDAQLHHQPTPNSVGQAQHAANKHADTALEQARKADAANDEANCSASLVEARRLYDIKE